MGGSHSSLSVKASSEITAKSVQTLIQNCLTTSVGDNELIIDGSGNTVDNLHQRVSISVNASCQALNDQSGKFQDQMTSAVAQNLKANSVALTQWMDNSRQDSNSQLSQRVATEMDQKTVQNVVNNINGKNIVTIKGDNNLVSNTSQEAVLDLISQGLAGSQQATSAAASIAVSANQHQVSKSENPLAFIGDAIREVVGTTVGLIALTFILIVVLVLLYKYMRRNKGASGGAAAEEPQSQFETEFIVD